MKIQCNKADFTEALQVVHSIVSGKGTLPILSNVLMEAAGDEVVLTTTDLEMGIRKNFKAKVTKEGAITLPAKRLHAIMRELPVEEVTLETGEQGEAVIRYRGSYFKILGLPKEEFPPFPDFKKQQSVTIPQSALKKAIRTTHYAVSHDESRYVLNGICMIMEKGKISAVATDGRRLAQCKLKANIEGGPQIIIPTKAILELSRILSDEGDAVLYIGNNQLAIDMEQCCLVSRLIEGHYPNYSQVIPQKCDCSFFLSREELLSATRRVALLTSDTSNSMKLTFSKNRLALSTNTPEVGEAKEELTISYAGEERSIAFNPHYLIDALKNLVDEEVVFEMQDGLNPGVVKSGDSFLYVIMPIRLS